MMCVCEVPINTMHTLHIVGTQNMFVCFTSPIFLLDFEGIYFSLTCAMLCLPFKQLLTL